MALDGEDNEESCTYEQGMNTPNNRLDWPSGSHMTEPSILLLKVGKISRYQNHYPVYISHF